MVINMEWNNHIAIGIVYSSIENSTKYKKSQRITCGEVWMVPCGNIVITQNPPYKSSDGMTWEVWKCCLKCAVDFEYKP